MKVRHSLPWRVTYYLRDPATGRPVGGGRRAFLHQQRAEAFRDEQAALGYQVECWKLLPLRGVA